MEQTEIKIVESAISVLNDDLTATLETIAEHAGISRRTLHRHFKDRDQLIESCKNDMMKVCQAAMITAYQSSEEPLVQLEQMLYAGVDCGIKYAFLNKIAPEKTIPQIPVDEQEDDNIKIKWFRLVGILQQQGIISKDITIPWIFMLFAGMITTTITASNSGDVALNDVKRFAWFSFRKSIGID